MVAGGVLSNWTPLPGGTVYTARLTPGTNVEGTQEISVAAARFTSAGGVNNTASATAGITVDTKAPTVVITSSSSQLKVGQTATITFTLSEVVSLLKGDVSVTGGELGDISTSGLVRTATFTPTASINGGQATISIAANKLQDAAGNKNPAASLASPIRFDTKAPTVVITSSSSQLKFGQTARLTFTLGESISLTKTNFSVTGGTLSDIAGTGLTRTATFTPAASASGTATVTLAADAVQDAFGNKNLATSLSPSITYNTRVPSVTIAATKNDGTALSGNPGRVGAAGAKILFQLSEPCADFDNTDVTVIGGTLGTVGAATVTTRSISAGNADTDVVTTSVAHGFVVGDLVRLSDLGGGIGLSNKAYYVQEVSSATTLKLSETSGGNAVNFTSNVTAGTLERVVQTATFTPTAGFNGVATITILASRFTNGAGGNGNLAATSLRLAVDQQAPSIRISTAKRALKAGETATVTFTLSEAVNSLDSSRVSVVGGGIGGLTTVPNTGGLVRTATFTPDLSFEGQATISILANQVQDDVGNGNVLTSVTPPLIIDTKAPAAVTVSLASDTGISNADNITNIGTLKISGQEAGTSVQYSLDKTTWSSSFRAVNGANTVYARQIDRAGNPSPSSTALAFTLLTGSAKIVSGPTLPEGSKTTGDAIDYAVTFDRTVVYQGPDVQSNKPFIVLDQFNLANASTQRQAKLFTFADVGGVTGAADTDIITATGNSFANLDVVRFSGLTGGAGLSNDTNYVVRNKTGDTFQLSLTAAGDIINFTNPITAGTAQRVVTGVTGASGTKTFTTTAAHGFANGDAVQFVALTGGSSLSASTTYFVRERTSTTFKLSLTATGDIVDLGSNVTAATLRKVGGATAMFRYSVLSTDRVATSVIPGTTVRLASGGTLVDLAGNAVQLGYRLPIRLPRVTVNS